MILNFNQSWAIKNSAIISPLFSFFPFSSFLRLLDFFNLNWRRFFFCIFYQSLYHNSFLLLLAHFQILHEFLITFKHQLSLMLHRLFFINYNTMKITYLAYFLFVVILYLFIKSHIFIIICGVITCIWSYFSEGTNPEKLLLYLFRGKVQVCFTGIFILYLNFVSFLCQLRKPS